MPVNSNSVAFVSSNLVDWVPSFSQTNSAYTGMPLLTVFGGNQFVNYSISSRSRGFFYTSSNGILGVINSSLLGVTPLFFTYGQGTFVTADDYVAQSIFQSGVFATNSNSSATSLGISTYPGVTINGTAGAESVSTSPR